MAISDFTGQNIQDTYQRVVQTDSTNQLADGTGSIFIPVSASHAITASHALFAISASHEITFELSSSHAVSADTASFATDFEVSNDLTVNRNILLSDGSVIQNGDNNQPSITFGEDNLTLSSTQGEDVIINQGATIQGNATINGNISTTGDSTFGNASTDTHTFNGAITASGNISASGNVIGNRLFVQDLPLVKSFTDVISFGTSNIFAANITASGNISASGEIFASRYNGNVTNTTGYRYPNLTNIPSGIISSSLHIFTALTSSGNISASGNLIADKIIANVITGKADGTGIVLGSENDIHVTASGNISASGNIVAQSFTGSLLGESTSTMRVVETVKNVTGAQVTKTRPIHFSGSSNGVVTFILCDADDPTTMPCHGILNETLQDGETGEAIVIGEISGINTSNFTTGQTIFVNSGGGFTANKPTGSALIQNIGTVKVSANPGNAEIFGAGRTNDVPNLFEGQIFFGSGSDQAFQTHISGALDTTVINNITASGNISASGELIGIINGGTF